MTEPFSDKVKTLNSMSRMHLSLPALVSSFHVLATQIIQATKIYRAQLSDYRSAIRLSHSQYHTRGIQPCHPVEMSKVVICAGPLKTGTTSLEAYMHDIGLTCSPYGKGLNAFMANDIISIGNQISSNTYSFYQDLPLASASFLEQLLRAFPSIANDALFIYTFRDINSAAASLYAHVIRQRQFLGGSRKAFSTKLVVQKYVGKDFSFSDDDQNRVTTALASFYRQHKEQFDSLVAKHRLNCLYLKMDAVSNAHKAALVSAFISPYVLGDSSLMQGLFPIHNTKESPSL